MKSLYSIALLAFAAMPCSPPALVAWDDSAERTLLSGAGNSRSSDPESTAAGETNTFDHVKESIGGENGLTDIRQRQIDELAVGTPEDVAKHLARRAEDLHVSLGRHRSAISMLTGLRRVRARPGPDRQPRGQGSDAAPVTILPWLASTRTGFTMASALGAPVLWQAARRR